MKKILLILAALVSLSAFGVGIPLAFFKTNPTSTPSVPVDLVVTMDSLTVGSFATTTQMEAGTYGALYSSGTFHDISGDHSTSTAVKGGTFGSYSLPTNLLCAGQLFDGSGTTWAVKDANVVNSEEWLAGLVDNTETKVTFGFMYIPRTPAATQSGTTAMDLAAMLTHNAGGGNGAVGAWPQQRFDQYTADHEFEDNTSVYFNSHLSTAPFLATYVPILMETFIDWSTGVQTNAVWNLITGDQIGAEYSFTNNVGIATDLGQFALWPFNSTTWTGSAPFPEKLFFMATNAHAIFPISAALGKRPPDNFVATVASYTNVTLSWTSVPQASGYNIDYSTNAGSTWSNLKTNFLGTTATTPPLVTGASYVFRINTAVSGFLSQYENSATVIPRTMDMVSWWKLGDDPSSGQIQDFASDPTNGVYINGAVRTTGYGGVGHASVFDLANSRYGDMKNPAKLQITGSLTLNGWVNFSTLPDGSHNYGFFSKVANGGNTGYMFYCAVSGGNGLLGILDPFSHVASTSVPGFTTGTWYMVTMVYDASALTLKTFINGVLSASTSAGSSIGNPNTDLLIGADDSTYSGQTDSLNQDYRVWNRAMPQAEVTALFNDGPATQ